MKASLSLAFTIVAIVLFVLAAVWETPNATRLIAGGLAFLAGSQIV